MISDAKGLAIALAGSAALLGLAYMYGHGQGKAAGERAALATAVRNLKDRGRINEKVLGLEPYRLCIELGGVPEQCADEGL